MCQQGLLENVFSVGFRLLSRVWSKAPTTVTSQVCECPQANILFFNYGF